MAHLAQPILFALALAATNSFAQSVRYAEGLVHGFIVVRTLEGEVIGSGELNQTTRGDRVTNRLALRFKDGSRHEETSVFSQRGEFRLLTDHIVQKGPSFPESMDMKIDRAAGEVRVRYTDDDGKEKQLDERLVLPANLANGLITALLKNLPPAQQSLTVPYLALTPKPHLIELAITAEGEDRFSIAGTTHAATRFVVKPKGSGLAKLVESLKGKPPADYHVWIFRAEAPSFVRSEAPLYFGGPVWRIELASPAWPAAGSSHAR